MQRSALTLKSNLTKQKCLVALKKRSSISPYGVNISCNKKQLLRKEAVSADYDFSEAPVSMPALQFTKTGDPDLRFLFNPESDPGFSRAKLNRNFPQKLKFL
jgi:hypothetical protein